MNRMDEWEQDALGAIPLHLDPEVARIFSGETGEHAERSAEIKAVYLARKEIEGKVKERIDRAMDLTCSQSGLVDGVWHVEGGTDPDGHTVNLAGEWGSVCTCGSHVWRHEFCKHLIRVEWELGAVLYDRIADFNPANESGCFKPGIFSRAVQFDLENAAYKAAKKEAGVS